MPSKLELLRECARRDGKDRDLTELILKIFEIESAQLHEDEGEAKTRQDELRRVIVEWVDYHTGEGEPE